MDVDSNAGQNLDKDAGRLQTPKSEVLPIQSPSEKKTISTERKAATVGEFN